MALRDTPDDDDRPEVAALFGNLKAALPQLQALLDKYNGDWEYEDRVYRFYHQSYKVYDLQVGTTSITEALQVLAPERELDEVVPPDCVRGNRQEVRAGSQQPLARGDTADRRGVLPRALHAGDGGQVREGITATAAVLAERLGGVPVPVRPAIAGGPNVRSQPRPC
jgi:hypothetical protein